MQQLNRYCFQDPCLQGTCPITEAIPSGKIKDLIFIIPFNPEKVYQSEVIFYYRQCVLATGHLEWMLLWYASQNLLSEATFTQWLTKMAWIYWGSISCLKARHLGKVIPDPEITSGVKWGLCCDCTVIQLLQPNSIFQTPLWGLIPREFPDKLTACIFRICFLGNPTSDNTFSSFQGYRARNLTEDQILM